MKIGFVFLFLIIQTLAFAQNKTGNVPPPRPDYFTGPLYFLSSDWMEGRAAGSRGGLISADFIASVMQFVGLKPYSEPTEIPVAVPSDYFQDFKIVKYTAGESSLVIIDKNSKGSQTIHLNQGIDFTVETGLSNSEAEAPIIFAGYGISAIDKGYDDYKGLEILGKIVVVMDGLPGQKDTTSVVWQRLSKSLPKDAGDYINKLKTVSKKGAVALIVVSPEESLLPKNITSDTLAATPFFDLPSHCLPGDTSVTEIPCFRVSQSASQQLLSEIGIDPVEYEKLAARSIVSPTIQIKARTIQFNVPVKIDTIPVRNVLGIIYGKDSTKSVFVGAHYDHLGIQNGMIYNGSDDNASGVAGMLALAKTWTESEVQPPCNIIFASWTAEEIGLLGSQYFAQQLINPEKILFYINMDMISRSAPEDATKRELSVGTRPSDTEIKEIILKNNSEIEPPFILDLWDVTGHTGSDYASFADRNIPVMTFFSGYQADYHTPQDDFSKVDLKKMEDVLKFVNHCLLDLFKNPGQ